MIRKRLGRLFARWRHFTTSSKYYQNLSGFFFPVKIRAFVIQPLLGKNEVDSGLSS